MKDFVCRTYCLILFSVTLLIPASLLAQSRHADLYDVIESPSPYAAAIARSRGEIEVLMDAGAPGVSIAVGVEGELIWAEGFGYADIEHNIAVDTQTKFRIGSVSKSMTSIALGLIYEQGLIDLDAPSQDYVREFPIKGRGEVTARLLASHRAVTSPLPLIGNSRT